MAEIAIAGATAAVRQAVVQFGKVLEKEGSRLFRATEDLEWIDNEMRYIQAYLQDVEDKQLGSRGLTNLVRNIWDIAYDVEDIVKTYSAKLSSRGRNHRKGLPGCLESAKFICTNFKTVRDFALEIEGIKKRVEDIDRVRRIYDIKERTGRDEGNTSDLRRTFHHADDVNVVGLDETIAELVAKVGPQDFQHRVVSIIGMPGLGKTTLARKVYNSVLQENEFQCSAWICVSQQPNIKDLLRDIAGQVQLEEQRWRNNFEANLFEHLRDRRYVIVIDDIWQTKAWDALRKGIPNNSQHGSRIILTSRNDFVGVHAGGQDSLIVLQKLNRENSKNLFFSVVGNLNPTDPPGLHRICTKILRRCKGVPLAIKLIAGMLSLRERTKRAWNGVLGFISEEDQYTEVSDLSYKDLPTKLKPCFLYSGLFPEDYKIPANELINLWVAEGLIQRGNRTREVEEVGEDYLNQLVARNMIQVVRRGKNNRRIKICCIHDVLRSFCVKVAKDINFFNSHNDVANTGNLSTTKVRRITADLHIPLDYRTPKLRAMLCFHSEYQSELDRKDLKKFLRDSIFLRVLSLEFTFLEISLPSAMGNLRYLTYIRLKVTYGHTKLPSSISNLRNLQTLDARGCRHLVIPYCIWNMKQLRHLLLSPSCKIKFCSGGLLLHPIEDSPSNLQTLYSLRVSRRPCSKYQFPKLFTDLRKLGVSFADGDLSNVKMLLHAATIVSHKLNVLRLQGYIQRSAKRYNILDLHLNRYENLFRLHLEGRMMGLPKHDRLPPNLTKLTLVNTQLEWNPMATLRKLPKLEILKLGEKSFLKVKLSAASTGDFPQLKVLMIDKLKQLEEIKVISGAMPLLQKIRLTGWESRDPRPEVIIPNRNEVTVSYE